MDALDIDQILRLLIAAGIGIAVGVNRELRDKPLGMRTLGLVSLGSAIAVLVAHDFPDFAGEPDARSRIVQGAVQGVLTGVGFIGAGVVLHDQKSATVLGLTTAATVWVTAAIGIACALAAWTLVLSGAVLTLTILFGVGWLECRIFPRK
jgi:putative Mg2+ transporter-C (MgtC) family protein